MPVAVSDAVAAAAATTAVVAIAVATVAVVIAAVSTLLHFTYNIITIMENV